MGRRRAPLRQSLHVRAEELIDHLVVGLGALFCWPAELTSQRASRGSEVARHDRNRIFADGHFLSPVGFDHDGIADPARAGNAGRGGTAL